MIEPKRGGIFAGMHSGGLYYSGDNGETWEKRSTGITIDQVFCVGYAYHSDKVALYDGTEPASMFRSDDYGESWVDQPGVKETRGRDKWSFPSPPHLAHVKTMTVDPKTHRVYLLAAEYGPAPEAKAGEKKQRAPVVPDSFHVLVIGK